jgi:23S rRNA (guanosine2251-2'-O)-methyltransferase
MPLELKNPHSILAAIRHRSHDVREIRVRGERPLGAWREVLDIAARQGVPIVQESGRSQRRGDRKRPVRETERLGGCSAVVRERPAQSIEEVLPAGDDPPESGLWLALDCLQDPHNVGAILRSASFFGVRGVLLTKDRSAPLNATVYDISAGGMEALPICPVVNLRRALEQAKQAGLWILGTSEHAETDLADVDRRRPWLIVIGNEQTGMRRLTSEQCDLTCRLSPHGEVTSLNASVATGAILAVLSST